MEQRVEMTVSLEQLAGLEEKEEEEKSGSFGSWLDQTPICASISRWRVVHRRCEGCCPAVVVGEVEVCGGRMRSVGVVKVCGTVLEMGQ